MISKHLYSALSKLPEDGSAILYRQLPEGSGEALSRAAKRELLSASKGLEDDSLLRLTEEGIAAMEEYSRAQEAHSLLKKSARDAKAAKWLSSAAAALAAVSLLLSLLQPMALKAPSAGSPAPAVSGNVAPAENVSTSADGLAISAEEFDGLWAYFQQRQKQRLETPFDSAQIDAVLVENPQDSEAITDAELELMMQQHPRPATLSVEAAREDVDLMLRAFRACYAAYYYFGEAEFENSRQLILSQLPESGSIDTAEFELLVSGAFAFLKDAHAGVFPQGAGLEFRPYENNVRQRYYYSDLCFLPDSAGGYVTVMDGEAWQFAGFTDERVQMEPSLQPDGSVCYSPVLMSSEMEVTDSELLLKNGKEEQSIALHWLRADSYLDYYSGDPNYQLMLHNGVCYISERAFQSFDPAILEQFAADGSIARQAELIVFDIRSNGGGDDRYAADWLRSFSGSAPRQNMLFATRGSKLTQRMGNSTPVGTYEKYQSTGSVIPNDIPIVVLVDDRCGSSGESMLNDLRNMDNVIVVGSNSAGFQLCGNVTGLTLPNSGMIMQFGTSLSFQYSPESVDFAGYEPDIWCNPRTALSAVWNMLVKYGKISPEQIPQVNEGIAQQGGGEVMTTDVMLRFQDSDVPSGSGFGTPETGPHFIDVMLHGERVTDYTLELDNPAACECEIMPDGTLKLTRIGPGSCRLTISLEGYTADFNWFGGDEAPVELSNCDMAILYGEFTVLPGNGFGSPEPGITHPLTVLLNGQPISDYQVENGNPAACSCEIDANGILQLTRLGPGGSELTIRAGDNWAVFNWFGGE